MRWLVLQALLSGCAPVPPSHAADAQAVMRTDPATQPHELGRIHWIRDLEQGRALSRRSGKPLLVLFTEVPGCSTVNGFADKALEHPLLVEATEDLFVPVVIYNNTTGDADAAVRTRFREPAWNNPVVRVFSPGGDEIAPRYASGWTAQGYAETLAAGLRRSGEAVPDYLANLARGSAKAPQTSVFSMYCFWSGEVGLAGLPGVLTTKPGFLAGREVVEVTWDPSVTELQTLARQAAESGVATGYIARSTEERAAVSPHLRSVAMDQSPVRYSDQDDKYQLRHTNWRSLGLSDTQATALNRAWVTQGEDAASVLSPRQRRQLK